MLKRARKKASELIVDIDGSEVPVRLLRKANARRYILRVRNASRDVVLTMPPHGSLGEAEAFARRQKDWIKARLDSLPEQVRFDDGAILPFRGAPHLVEHRESGRAKVWIEKPDMLPLLPEDGYPRICVSGRYLQLRRRLKDWLMREAERELAAQATRYAAALGVSFKRISVRDQKSRWGSCSNSGTLAFSWRLILAPSFVLSYLAAHEVAHIRHMNHSSDFWSTLRSICPETDEAEAWLDENGRQLHGYDV